MRLQESERVKFQWFKGCLIWKEAFARYWFLGCFFTLPLAEEKDGAKPLSTAVEELWEEKVKILGDDEEAEE